MTVQEIYAYLHSRAPFDTAEGWDNPGMLVGDPHREVSRVLVALDATAGAVDTAEAVCADLIVTHHPVIFAPLKKLSAQSIPYRLAAAGIDLIAAHTNLDKAEGGVNDTLAARLGLTDVVVAPDEYTRIGTLPQPMSAKDFATHVARVLDTAVRYSGDKEVQTVAVCGGSGGDFMLRYHDADAYVTGEVRHHEWLAADHLNVIEAGHYATEVPVVDTLAAWLTEAFPDLTVIPYRDGEPYSVVK
ncbi:MAG: Nif3-like dinuclear metal center hexameric protein [Clostridia bacterium]|nr:Nif3-like dinuclear metal center hexameric protein [Clostridia bacterium]